MVSPSHRRATLVAILTMLTNPTPPPVLSENACPMCGHEGKYDTGECSFCGVYKCNTCEKHHLGNPAQPCNGHGVDLSRST